MRLLWMCVITGAVIQVSVLLTTIYLHRSLTHRGLELNRTLSLFMHLYLALFTGIRPRQWVAVHRKHHHFSDGEGDPHSPLLYGLWTVFFCNAFLYGREARNLTTIRKYTPDYREDLIDRIPAMRGSALGGLMIFSLLFGWRWGVPAFLLQAVVYILLNSSINSICHVIGYRNFDNQATNLRTVALLTGGEGLHNNHHEYPTSARFSLKGSEIDPAWPLIRLLEKIGLAKVNHVSIAQAS